MAFYLHNGQLFCPIDDPDVDDVMAEVINEISEIEDVTLSHAEEPYIGILMNSPSMAQYGMPRRSGRYPYGSGDNPYQHSNDFLSRISELKKKGLSDTEIAKSFNMSTTEFRASKAIANSERRADQVATAKRLVEKEGYSLRAAAEAMGFKNDSSVRALLNEQAEKNMSLAMNTAETLKKIINERGMIDVGAGVERELGISETKLKEALYIIQNEGYEVYGGGVAQATNPGKQTVLRVACPPGTEHKEIYNYDQIHSIVDYTSKDGGETFQTYQYPASMSSKRLQIKYAEEGGVDKDGVIEVRRGCKDLDLGDGVHYAQVRILVDGTHYLKGMAVYSDNLPEGCDVRFNTNKKKGTPMEDTLKSVDKNLKKDPTNPFGSLIKANGQSYYIDENGNKKLSLINKRAEEGDWAEWSDKLPSQFLAKQSLSLINRQLNETISKAQSDLDEIRSLTNPTVKKALLNSFAEDCDAAAVNLKAASLPRQKYEVILPLTSIKETEVYAPNFQNGEKVALVRYPHGGTFEIPILTVNNNVREGNKVIGKDSKDAVGISSKVAERLSGADFDGDTVTVIPTGKNVKITSTPPLAELKGFDTKQYKGTMKVDPKTGKEVWYNAAGKPYKIMSNTQTQMGIVSNLITDMTLKGADEHELARAVKHSMVVIDAEKHKLDYQASYEENNIAALHKKYQGHIDADGKERAGASTILSRAKSKVEVNKRVGSPKLDAEGNLEYKSVVETFVDPKTGKTRVRTQEITRMANAKDARDLLSKNPNPKEIAYADYANARKQMARDARLEAAKTKDTPYSPLAKKKYLPEVNSLNAKLDEALKNAPRERQAQLITSAKVKTVKQDNPDIEKAELKKIAQKTLTESRKIVGAQRTKIEITENEWAAIQEGAISSTKLTQIIRFAGTDQVKQLSMPRSTNALSDAKISRLRAMRASGKSTAEIAEALGVSTSTIWKYAD